VAVVGDLSVAFFNSLVYWIQNDTRVVLSPIFSTRVMVTSPLLNLSNQTLPFIAINHYNTTDGWWVQPDEAGVESRLVTYEFTIGVYCDTYANQRYYPHLVKREIEKETTVESGLTKDGIQVYKDWTVNVPLLTSTLCVAEPHLGNIFPLGGEDESDEIRLYRSMIDGWVDFTRDKSKILISTDT